MHNKMTVKSLIELLDLSSLWLVAFTSPRFLSVNASQLALEWHCSKKTTALILPLEWEHAVQTSVTQTKWSSSSFTWNKLLVHRLQLDLFEPWGCLETHHHRRKHQLMESICVKITQSSPFASHIGELVLMCLVPYLIHRLLDGLQCLIFASL